MKIHRVINNITLDIVRSNIPFIYHSRYCKYFDINYSSAMNRYGINLDYIYNDEKTSSN